MKKILLVLSLAAVFAGLPALAAPAADPQTTAAVKAMFDAMELRKTMAAANAEMEKALPAMFRAQIAGMIEADGSLSPQQKTEASAKFERGLPSMTKGMIDILRDPVLMDQVMVEMVPLYANNFTTDEINELAVFYRTPLGRKMMAVTPRLSAECMAISQKIVMPRIGKLIRDVMQELQKQ
jgi:hypothetical protein